MGAFGSSIKSIQIGTVDLSVAETTDTATISSVDPDKAIINYLGAVTASLKTTASFADVTLTDATTVTANRNEHDSSALTVRFQVVEYY